MADNETIAEAETLSEQIDSEHNAGPARSYDFVGAYVREIIVLLLGLFIGFFWNEYSDEVGAEGHIIIALLIIVLCLIRLVFYITRE